MEQEMLTTQEIIGIGKELLEEFALAFEVLSK